MTASHGRVLRVVLPRGVEGEPRHPFPLLASIAPVVGSLVMWAITSSPYALVFALLGPVIAVASVGDSRIQARRTRRREQARVRDETARARDAIVAAHDHERRALERLTPGAIAAVGSGSGVSDRWRGSLASEVPVLLGRGEVSSAIVFSGDVEQNAALVEQASVLVGAPLVVDARLGIGVCGPEVLRRSVFRSIVLQVANALPPTALLTAYDLAEPWLDDLPHRGRRDARGAARVEFADDSGVLVIALAHSSVELPYACRVRLQLGGSHALLTTPDEPGGRLCGPEYVSADQAAKCGLVLADAAAAQSLVASSLPGSVAFAALPQVGEVHRSALAATIGMGHESPVFIDLVAHGPHAVVGGMTGSGKSELLLTWMLGLASRHDPQQVSFMLVDFKGGASFGDLVHLPHVVGLLTDLDEHAASRALLSLRAEIKRRERVLADHHARAIDELQESIVLPRLVIVVDEFAALLDGFDDLHRLFADLAARGRSLGIHLVLCTQRPSGVVRDSVLANVPLRISLAVNNRADSTAVIGTDAAATLSEAPRGRALLAIAGADPIAVQVALAARSDVQRVIAQWSAAPPAFRPWLDDLPHEITLDQVPRSAHGVPFGILDLPQQQAQPPAVWDPSRDGNLLVLGAAGSGRTSTIDTVVTAAGGLVLPAEPIAAWDVVAHLLVGLREGRAMPDVVGVDDADLTAARLGGDHGAAFVDALVELARIGPSVGLHLVVGLKRAAATLQPLISVCESRLLLRLADRQEHLASGGDSQLFAPDAPAGRGEWRGCAVQVGHAAASPVAMSLPADPVLVAEHWPLLLVVTNRPQQLAAQLAAHYAVSGAPAGEAIEVSGRLEAKAFIADPETWQAAWTALAALRPRATMLFDQCTVADYRAVGGTRELPPPLPPGGDSAWLVEPGRKVMRVQLPTPTPARAQAGAEHAPLPPAR